MVRNIIYLICITVIFQNVGFSVETETGLELNFDKVIQLSRQRTLDIQLSNLRVEMSSVRASAAGARRSGLEIDLDTAYRSEGDERNDYGITVKQTLDLWRKQPRVQSAAAQLQIQTAQSQLIFLRIIRENIGTYYNALYANEKLELSRQSTQLYQELLKTTEAKVKAGASGDLDLNRARIALARSQSNHARNKVNYYTHLTDLQKQLDLPLDQVTTLKGELSWSHLDTAIHPDSKVNIPKIDFFNHPELSALDAEMQSAHAQISSAHASGKPEIGIMAGYEQEEGVDIGHVGVSLALQVGSRTTARKHEAQILLQSAELQYEKSRRSLLTECISLWKKYLILKAAYQTHAADAGAAIEKNSELVMKSFNAGQLPLGDVLNIRRELIEAKLEQLTLKHALTIAALDFSIAAALPPFTQNEKTTSK